MTDLNWAQPVPIPSACAAGAGHRHGSCSPACSRPGRCRCRRRSVGGCARRRGQCRGQPRAAGAEIATADAIPPGPVAVLEQAKPGAAIAYDAMGRRDPHPRHRGIGLGCHADHHSSRRRGARRTATHSITFGVAATGLYAISYPGELAFGTADGTEVVVNDSRRLVMVQSGLPSVLPGKTAAVAANGEVNLPNDDGLGRRIPRPVARDDANGE